MATWVEDSTVINNRIFENSESSFNSFYLISVFLPDTIIRCRAMN